VFHLVAEGVANKAIASELGISGRTVEVHRSQVRKRSRSRHWRNWCAYMCSLNNQPEKKITRGLSLPALHRSKIENLLDHTSVEGTI
jgi:hypothetical protein